MSRTIEEKVVSLKFDNQKFKTNIADTMSALDKFKEKLNFTGASRGLSDISSSVKKVDMKSLGDAVEAVKVRFSSLQVIGMTALANITNSAVNAGKRMLSALTIDPIKTGFQEYETQINAVQTILANTSSKGKTLDDVNGALDELNKYADQTIYNFTEMTRNIGTFTAAGVDLDTSVNAIKGIANLAAVSGSTSQQASTAMYQLSQALASGTVKLMDWNSVVNAGMGGQIFQDALMETARVHGIAIDKLIKKHGSFRETLQAGWLTSEVLTETLQKFTLTTEGLTESQIEANKQMLKSKGYTDDQIQAIFDLGKTATNAATKVKTFTQLWDVLKEAAQSGWTQTWEIVIGDFEEAQALLTPISDSLTGFINNISDARNSMLENALGTKWNELTTQINEAGVTTEKFNEVVVETAKENGVAIDDLVKEYGSLRGAVDNGKVSTDIIVKSIKKLSGAENDVAASTEEMSKKLTYFQDVVEDVWQGSYKNGEERIKALADAGYEYAEVQELVNRTVDGHKLTLKDLSEAQLASVGYTEEEIKKLKELAAQAEATGTPLNDLVTSLENSTGRTLLIESFKNIIEAIQKPLEAVRDAWVEIFGEGGDKSQVLYNLVEGFHELTENMIISDQAASNFQKVFEGLFAVFNLVNGGISKSLNSTFKLIKSVLSLFGTDLWSLMGILGDYMIKLKDWVEQHTLYLGGLDKMAEIIYTVIENVRNLAIEFAKLEPVQEIISKIVKAVRDLFESIGFAEGAKLNFDGFIESLQKAFDKAITWVQGLEDSEFLEIGVNIVDGLINGIKAGLSNVITAIINIGKTILAAIKNVLGIHSPSTEFAEVGMDSMTGLLNGFKDGASSVWEFIKVFGQKCIDIIKNIDFGAVFAAAFGVGMLLTVKQLTGVLEKLTTPIEGFGNMMDGLGSMFKDIGNRINPKKSKWEEITDGIQKMAISIAILVGAIALLAQCDIKAAWSAVGVVAALAAIMTLFGFALKKLELTAAFDIKVGPILALASSLLIVSLAMKMIASLEIGEMYTAIVGLAAIVTAMVGFVLGFSKFADKLAGINLTKVGSMLLKLSVALLLMLAVIKLASGLEIGEVIKGVAVIYLVEGLFVAMTRVSETAGKYSAKAGSMLLRMSLSLLLMIGVVKAAAQLKLGDVVKGVIVVAAIETLFIGLVAVSNLAGPNAVKAGLMISLMGSALNMAVIAVKIAASIPLSDVLKGITVITAVGVLFAGLVAVSQFAGKEAIRAGTMLITASIALLVVAAALFLISEVYQANKDSVWQAVGIITVLEVLFGGLIAVSKFAVGAEKNLLYITIAIGILIAAAVGLSFIDSSRLAASTAAISAMLISFGVLLTAADSLGKKRKGAMKSMLQLMGIVILLGAVVALLSYLETDSAVQSCIGISLLLITMTASLAVLDKIKGTATKGIIGLMLLSVVIAELGYILKLITDWNIGPSIETVKSISALLLVMTGVLAVLSLIGGRSIAGVGALALLGLVVAELAVILGLMDHFDVNPSIETAKSLSILLLSMSAALVPLTLIGSFAPAALAGVGVLASFILAIGGLMVSIGGLTTLFPKIEEFLNKGIPILEKIGHGLGSFFGNMVGGFIDGATNGLPELGDKLSDFISKALPFIEGVKQIDNDSIVGVQNLSKAVTTLTAADFLDRLTHFKGSSFADLGTKLSEFIENAEPFITNVGTIDADTMKGTKALAETLYTLTTTNILDGLTSWFTGGNDLVKFGMDLASFAPYMRRYAETVVGIDGEAIQASANAAKALGEMASALPKTGGLVAYFTGENNMQLFGEQIAYFGAALKDYSRTVTGMEIEPVEKSVSAAKALADVANAIPNFSGLVTLFTGDNDLVTFGTQLITFGGSLKNYSLAVVGTDYEAIEASVSAAKSLSKLAKNLPESGGFASLFSADNDLSTFGNEMAKFGSSIKTYSNNVAGIDITVVEASVTAANKIMELIRNAEGLDVSGVETYRTALYTLAETSVSGFVKAFDESYSSLYSAGSKMVKAVSDGINGQKSAIYNVMNTVITGIIDKVNQNKTKFKTAAENSINQFSEGIKTGKSDVILAVTKMMSGVMDYVRDYKDDFYSAGAHLVEGFAKGIKDNTWEAEARSRSMARAALKAAEDELGIASPSKEFAEVGKYSNEGLAEGLIDNAYLSEEAARDLGDSLIINISEGIDKNTSAEDAAAKKAQNITNAFQKEFDNIDLDVSTADLEYELWSKLYGDDASQGELLAKELDLLNTKLEKQKERVNLAQNEYQMMLKTFGEDSENTQEAYNKLLQEQVKMVELSNTIIEKQGSVKVDQKEALLAYSELMRENYDDLIKAGLSAKEIDDWARFKSGYTGSIHFGLTVEVSDESKQEVIKTSESIALEGAEAMKAKEGEWVESGNQLAGGFVDGINANTSEAASAGEQLANAALGGVNSALDINSPSKETYKAGRFAGMGFVKALSDYADICYNVASEVGESAKEGLKNAISKIAESIDTDMDMSPTIRPVLDMSEIQNGSNQLDSLFANRSLKLSQMNAEITGKSDELNALVAKLASLNESKDSKVVDAITTLRGEIGTLKEAMANMYVKLDSGALVGGITTQMDVSLGKVAVHKGRGN